MRRLLFLLLFFALALPASAQAIWEDALAGMRKVLSEEGRTLVADRLVSLSDMGDPNKLGFFTEAGAEGYIIAVAYTYVPTHSPAMSGYFQYAGDNARVNLTVKGSNGFYYLYAKVGAKPGFTMGEIVVNSPLRDYAIPCRLLIGKY